MIGALRSWHLIAAVGGIGCVALVAVLVVVILLASKRRRGPQAGRNGIHID